MADYVLNLGGLPILAFKYANGWNTLSWRTFSSYFSRLEGPSNFLFDGIRYIIILFSLTALILWIAVKFETCFSSHICFRSITMYFAFQQDNFFIPRPPKANHLKIDYPDEHSRDNCKYSPALCVFLLA